jgi:hypothetical protein
MITVNDTFSMLSTHLRELCHYVKRTILQWRSYPSTVSARFCPNITSRLGLLLRRPSSFLHPVKDDLALKMPGVYSIPCECRKVYLG